MSELQLAVGKSYLNRKGDVVYIIGNDGMGKYSFYDIDGRLYKVDGKWGYTEDNWRDLISEAPCDHDFERGAQHEDDAQHDSDPVNHPKHYTDHPSGIECIQITEHMGFCLGNATKYIWRADLKHDAIEDLRKAIWYIEREIAKRSQP